MRRTLLRAAVGLLVLAAILGGLAWRRPELLGALGRFGGLVDPQTAVPAAPPGPQIEPAAETVDDGWCAARAENDPECLRRLPVIRLAGPDVARRIGLETAVVAAHPQADTIVGNAEIAYDEHAYAEVLPRVAGIVREVHAEHGQKVRPGDVLAVIDSAEVGSAKAQYLGALPLVKLAEATLKRTEELTRSRALPLKDELEASTALNRARADLLIATQRLKNLGFTDEELAAIERDVSSLLRIVAPIEGTVVERHAVVGEAISAQHGLVSVADLRVMWAWIDIHEGDIRRVRPGMKVELAVSGLEGRTFHGSVHWIDSAVNRTTRTIRVIAEVKNDEGLLRANQFGRGTIILGEPRTALLVPKGAVQTVGAVSLVFRASPDGSYRPQRVALRLGREPAPGLVEVEWGLEPGQRVVTTGSFLLASELLKNEEIASRLGR